MNSRRLVRKWDTSDGAEEAGRSAAAVDSRASTGVAWGRHTMVTVDELGMVKVSFGKGVCGDRLSARGLTARGCDRVAGW